MWKALFGPVVTEEKTFEVFSLYEFMKTSDPWGGAIFDPRAIMWIILEEVLFVCVKVLRPSQPNGIMSSAVSLPSHIFTGQA